MMFSTANNDKLPDTTSASAIRSSLEQHAEGKPIFNCDSTNTPYEGNASISGKNLMDIPNTAEMILFYESEEAHLGGRNVAYADGHVKWLTDSSWQEQKARSGIR
jgi:prepilin-type processing-associated H-X9-DG protein